MNEDKDCAVLRERVARLERSSRRMKKIGVTLALVGGTWLIMGQAAPKKIVEAEQFVLKDSNGKARGEFLVTESRGVTLRLKHPSGKPASELLVENNGCWLTMTDEAGVQRVALDMGGKSSALDLADDKGTVLARAAVGPELWYFALSKKDNQSLAGFQASPDGTVKLLMGAGVNIGVYPDERPEIALEGKKSKLTMTEDGGPLTLRIEDRDGKPLVELPPHR